ncbi:MAG: CCA tRNA nucleotidyltransferase [Geminicoccaceae bacterium]
MTQAPAIILDQPPLQAEPAVRALLGLLPEARLVGGCVRDTLARLPVADIDLATPRRPESVMETLTRAGWRVAPTGIAHGTVTASLQGRSFEVTTLRRDVETDGRRAVVAFTDDWRQDAARRDFTINALSMTADGAVYDYFGGIVDLQAGHVRFVGDPATRIAEDYLRILRFFRFQARYGRGVPDVAALAAIGSAVPGLATLSPERIWSELLRILAAPDPSASLELMAECGVLTVIVPEGAEPRRLMRLIAAGAPADPLLRLAALLDGDPTSFADRLRLSAAERTRLIALRESPTPDPSLDDAALRRLLADTPREILMGRSWLAGDGSVEWNRLRARLSTTAVPVFPLEGRDVLALGVSPGPQVGALLRALRAWWLAGGCVADAAACRAELARLCRG